MDVDIVPMELCHIDSVVKISEESFPVSWSKESYINEVKNPLAHYLVAILNNKIVGFIGVWIVIGEANITNIAVSKDFRGHSIANLLMNTALNLCKKNNVIDINLEVRASNIKAQNLYKKFGFIEEGIRKKYYEDNKEDAILMWMHNL